MVPEHSLDEDDLYTEHYARLVLLETCRSSRRFTCCGGICCGEKARGRSTLKSYYLKLTFRYMTGLSFISPTGYNA